MLLGGFRCLQVSELAALCVTVVLSQFRTPFTLPLLDTAPWNHVLLAGIMTNIGYQVGQASADMNDWVGSERRALTRLPSWATGFAESQGWATDGMDTMARVSKLRKQIILDDEASFRRDAAAFQRATADGLQGSRFHSAVAPLTLPQATPADVKAFVATLKAQSDSEEGFQGVLDAFKSRLGAAAGPSLSASKTEEGRAVLAGLRLALGLKSECSSLLAAENWEAGKERVASEKFAEAATQAHLLTERREALAMALSAARQQIAVGAPADDGVQYVQVPVIVDLLVAGVPLDPIGPDLPESLFTEPVTVAATHVSELESLVEAINKAVKESNKVAASAHGEPWACTSPGTFDISDDEVKAGLERIVETARLRIAQRLKWCSTSDMLAEAAASLEEYGEGDAAAATRAAAAQRDALVKSLLSPDGLSLQVPDSGAPSALVVEAWRRTLTARVNRQHLSAVMAEFGWDYSSAAQREDASAEGRPAALAALRTMVDEEAADAKAKAAVEAVAMEELVPAAVLRVGAEKKYAGVSDETIAVLARNAVVAAIPDVTASVLSERAECGSSSFASLKVAARRAFESHESR